MARKKQPTFTVQIQQTVVADFDVQADNIEEAFSLANGLAQQSDLFDTTFKRSSVAYTDEGKVIGIFGG